MVIVEDTRNQIGKHKRLNADLTRLGCKVIRSKLYVGDYARLDDMTVCIDTKKNWVELAGNICGPQHDRFRAECERARDNNIQLIVLIEEPMPLSEWQPPRKRNGQPVCKVTPEVLTKAIGTMAERYGVIFINCDKGHTAVVISKIFGGKNGDN